MVSNLNYTLEIEKRQGNISKIQYSHYQVIIYPCSIEIVV